MKNNCRIRQLLRHILQFLIEIEEMASKNGAVNSRQVLVTWHLAREGAEMSLQPWVDKKAAAFLVHAAHVLCVRDVLLQRQVCAIEPRSIVDMLPHQADGCLSTICLYERQVEVVHEVD